MEAGDAESGFEPYLPVVTDGESLATVAASGATPLHRDRAFIGMTVTQFLGAFNDNVFKFLIIFVVLTTIEHDETAVFYQMLANMLFAAPFIFFSGYAGHLSDRTPKRRIIIASKVAEVVLMLLGTVAFLTGAVWPLLVMLFLMGLQTTFFSPAKYGILPEMLRRQDLPMANGIISMTTFLAIIFGTVVGGVASELARTQFGGQYWVMNLLCVLIALAGALAACFLRHTPAASETLCFGIGDLFVASDTFRVIRADRRLLAALLVNSVFWFLAGVVQPTINEFGIKQLALGETATSILNGVLGLGIAIGFIACGMLSRGRIRFSMLPIGVLGISTSLGLVSLVTQWLGNGGLLYGILLVCFLVTGVSTGLFALPLVTYLQSRPPAAHRGRVIAVMNFLSWVGILLAAAFYYLCSTVLASQSLELSRTFAIIAVLMLPLGFIISSADESLIDSEANSA